MNKHQFSYMLEDTKLGLKRNRGSVTASVLLLFIALSLIGSLLLARAYVDDAINYVESQLAMKVYVEDGMAEDVAAILDNQSFAMDVTIESGEEMIKGLSFFFEGKEHLLKAFTDGSVPDAVKFQVTDDKYMDVIRDSLSSVAGINKVVYPQQMAQILAQWIDTIELYGTLVIVVFFVVAFLMIYCSFHLAMHQRSRELKVKLFLGMDPKIVRIQFLLEGAILGLVSAVFSMLASYAVYAGIFMKIERAVSFLGELTFSDLCIVWLVQLVGAVVLSVVASYFSTRKMIANV